jgi:hypothetical protein
MIYVTDVAHEDNVQMFLAVKISNDFIIDVFNDVLSRLRSLLGCSSFFGRCSSSSGRLSLGCFDLGLGCFSNDRLWGRCYYI